MSNVPKFIQLLSRSGSAAVFHRTAGLNPCPCLTPEGFRDPEWHRDNSFVFDIESAAHPPANGVYRDSFSYQHLSITENGEPFNVDKVHACVFMRGPETAQDAIQEIGVFEQTTITPSDTTAYLTTLVNTINSSSAQHPNLDPSWFILLFTFTQNGHNHSYYILDPFYAVTTGGQWDVPPEISQPHANTLVDNPVCNERGLIPDPLVQPDHQVKAFVQPIQSTRATRLNSEYMAQMFGEVQADDHLGIFPCVWNGFVLDFTNWSQSGDEFVGYNGRRFLVVNANLIPDPADGNPNHHWEVGLRLINSQVSAIPTPPSTPPVLSVAPVNISLPVLSGTAEVGQSLMVTPGTWSGTPTPTISHQWQRSNGGAWQTIAGQTATTYIPVTGDVGYSIRAVEIANNIAGSASVTTTSSDVVIAIPPVSSVVPEFPIISRGVPVFASHDEGPGQFAAANAVGSDYGQFWRSIFSPNVASSSFGGPQWLAMDLRGVASAAKSKLWFVWKNPMTPYYLKDPSEVTLTDWQASPLGSDPASLFRTIPRNYVLQAHASSGTLPAVGDAGWTTLVTVTDNRYNSRVHAAQDGNPAESGIDLSGYNWFRIYITAANGPTFNDDITLRCELRDARTVSGGAADSIFMWGDSISMDGFNERRPDGVVWPKMGPIESALQIATGRVAPLWINGARGGYTAAEARAQMSKFLETTPCKYVLMHVGANDANQHNVDLNTEGGVNAPYSLQFKADMQAIIDQCVSEGRKVILHPLSWNDVSPAWSTANIGVFNQVIAQLVVENPTTVINGADEYTIYSNHHELLVDHLHPTWDDSVSAGTWDSGTGEGAMTGYEHFIRIWRDALIARLYT